MKCAKAWGSLPRTLRGNCIGNNPACEGSESTHAGRRPMEARRGQDHPGFPPPLLGYLAAPLMTKSAARSPQAEQRSRRAQSMTVVCRAVARDLIGGSGLGPVSAGLAPHDKPDL